MKFHNRIVEEQEVHPVAVLSFKLNDRWFEFRTREALEVAKLDDGDACRGATDQMAARHHRSPALLFTPPGIRSRGASVNEMTECDRANAYRDNSNQCRQAIEPPSHGLVAA
jgi:hypothetical protein